MNEAFNRDCVEAMKEFPDGFFDLAVVDPPYGIGVQTMDYTKSGAKRAGRNSAAKRRDYRRTDEWDIKPGPEYFAELFRVSKKAIIWGAITSPICSRRQKVFLFGINDAAIIQTISPIASSLGSRLGSASPASFVTYGTECYKAICKTKRSDSIRHKSPWPFIAGYSRITRSRGLRYSIRISAPARRV